MLTPAEWARTTRTTQHNLKTLPRLTFYVAMGSGDVQLQCDVTKALASVESVRCTSASTCTGAPDETTPAEAGSTVDAYKACAERRQNKFMVLASLLNRRRPRTLGPCPSLLVLCVCTHSRSYACVQPSSCYDRAESLARAASPPRATPSRARRTSLMSSLLSSPASRRVEQPALAPVVCSTR